MVVRELASLRCGPGSIPGPGVTRGLSFYCFFLSLFFVEGFSPVPPVFFPPQKPKF